MNRPEQSLHQSVARYLDATLHPDVFWTTIPAGGGGKLRGAILNGMGYKAGTPDVLICHAGRAHFIELKAPTGRLSNVQKGVLLRLSAAGCETAVCRSLLDVSEQLAEWRIPSRGRIAA